MNHPGGTQWPKSGIPGCWSLAATDSNSQILGANTGPVLWHIVTIGPTQTVKHHKLKKESSRQSWDDTIWTQMSFGHQLKTVSKTILTRISSPLCAGLGQHWTSPHAACRSVHYDGPHSVTVLQRLSAACHYFTINRKTVICSTLRPIRAVPQWVCFKGNDYPAQIEQEC